MSVQLPGVIICLCLSSSLFAQVTIDSARTAVRESIKKGNKEELAIDYAQLAYAFFGKGTYDSAVFYYQRSRATENFKNADLIASNLNGIATAYGFLGRADSSIYYYQEALAAYNAMHDTLHISMVELNLSILFKNLALYDKALEYAFRAIESHEQLEEWQSLSSCYSNVSAVYMNLGDFPNALNYAHLALDTRRKIGYTRGVGMSLNNIAEIYLKMKRYDSAYVNLTRALEIKRSIDDRKTFANTYSNLGTVMLALGRIADAESYFRQALSLRVEFKEKVGEAGCYNNLARIALLKNDHYAADKLLTEAEQILRVTDAPETMRENLEIRIQACEVTRQYPLAVEYMRKLLVVKDSILSDEKAESITAWQIRYETFRKEQQIIHLQEQGELKSAELQAKQAMIYGLTGGVFLLVVIAGLAYNNFRVAKKGKMMQELFNRELNHRVKNNLQLLASVLSLQSQELQDEVAVTAVKRNEGRVNAMALIHRKLYVGDNLRTIQLKEYARELVNFLLYSYSYREGEIGIDLDVEDLELDVDRAIPLGLIMNELVSNALKYAFHSQPDPKLGIRIVLRDAKDIHLEVEDNGIGYTPGAEDPEKSFGTKMIHLLVKELRGTIQYKSEDGTSVFIKIPLK